MGHLGEGVALLRLARLLHRVAIGLLGAIQRAHVGDCVLLDELCEVTRHGLVDRMFGWDAMFMQVRGCSWKKMTE